MIFVTGGTGLTGAHLLLALAGKGQKIRALKRPSGQLDYVKMVFDHYAENPDMLFKSIEWAEGNLLDIPSLEKAMHGAEHVYHLAAKVSFHKKDRQEMMNTNVSGTANMVNVALDLGVKKLCFVSSIAALGRAENNGIIDENTPWVNSSKNSAYSISKYNAEKEVWRGIEEGLAAIIINPSIILGLSSPKKGSTQIFSTVWNGLRIYPPGINGFVDVRDMVRIMIGLMECDIKNERFVVNAGNLPYKDLLWQIADIYGKSRPAIKANRPMSHITWRFFMALSLLTGKPPLITRETAETAMNEYMYSSEKVKKQLNFEFIDLRKTIEDTALNVKNYYLNKA